MFLCCNVLQEAAKAAPAAAPAAAAAPAPVAAPTPVAAAPVVAAAPAPVAAAAAAAPAGRVNASPLARRLATERGIPLSSVSGTGPNRRIVKDDILEFKAAPAAAAASVSAAPVAAGAHGEYQDIPHTNIRKVTDDPE